MPIPIPDSIKSTAVAGGKWATWFRVLLLANVALAIKRHLDLLDGEERRELAGLVGKSKGRPSNLTARERTRLRALVDKLEPGELARETVETVIPGRWGRR
jgi:hypothetical protein